MRPNPYQNCEEPLGFEYSVVQKGTSFEASIPYRQIVWLGNTEREAIGSMMRGIAQLARDGSLNPDCPSRTGSPPVQFALDVLTEELGRAVELRREDAVDASASLGQPALLATPDFARRNEVVSGIATAIAALARVKEL
jgi:hypothetical protein